MTPPVLALSRTAPVEAGIVQASARTQQRLSDLVKEFLAAHEASVETSERARMADCVALDDEAERARGEAEDVWALVMREASASGADVPEDVLDLGWEYWAARPQVSMPARATTGDWRESVAAVDWSRGRA